ncbi:MULTISPECIES: transcription elongation factor GreB [unclassified Colwellia]|jgi:transcription elongation factor GreB|uniref:transcription elongation factor GreB n=2 Tax=Colwellia TaxID=28228 RepID=UPI0015F5FCBF|nr:MULTISPECIES: transcription elongation factor GreB [unclassified Colwellia]MBA6251916.1 transcription elongation factor GreB [Colwellia sp. MB3u-55]MBA6377847.1 transcription elongation factor GreB [Colwellia sp. BRX10-7]MBA6387852.1 transcription elongation factor GreB [Colwellia sp. BRX10-2]MBA6399402.1 transcription elongation factor GreB [Colwellia sp. BRX10-4]MBA6400855.1 transcription elongation factor GreB [Colwellia sp. BRX10-5]
MKRSNYITRAGWDRLDKELKYLWKEERPLITKSVSEAAAQGDRSENAEYIYGKRRLREIDRRVRFLVKRTEDLTIVYYDAKQEGKVYFGAWVSLINEDDKELTYRVVGPDEWDVKKGEISLDSPMARALIGKCVDDEVVVQTPEGERVFDILKIWYK